MGSEAVSEGDWAQCCAPQVTDFSCGQELSVARVAGEMSPHRPGDISSGSCPPLGARAAFRVRGQLKHPPKQLLCDSLKPPTGNFPQKLLYLTTQRTLSGWILFRSCGKDPVHMELSNSVHENMLPSVLSSGMGCGRWYPSVPSYLHCSTAYGNRRVVTGVVKSAYLLRNKLLYLMARGCFLQKIFPLLFGAKLSMSSFPLQGVVGISLWPCQWWVLFCTWVGCGLQPLHIPEGVCKQETLGRAGLLCVRRSALPRGTVWGQSTRKGWKPGGEMEAQLQRVSVNLRFKKWEYKHCYLHGFQCRYRVCLLDSRLMPVAWKQFNIIFQTQNERKY